MATHSEKPEAHASQDKHLHRLSDVLLRQKLDVDFATGLHDHTARERLEKYGPNELEEDEKETFWDKIKEQFEDRMVRLLLLAAAISFIVGYFGIHSI